MGGEPVDLFYWLTQEGTPPSAGEDASTHHAQPLRILAEIIVDEAHAVDGTVVRLAHLQPRPMHIVEARAESCGVDEGAAGPAGMVQVTVTWRLTVTFADVDGEEHTLRRRYRLSRQIPVAGARPGMDVQADPRLVCRHAAITESQGETLIQCSLSLGLRVTLTRRAMVELPHAAVVPPPEPLGISFLGEGPGSGSLPGGPGAPEEVPPDTDPGGEEDGAW